MQNKLIRLLVGISLVICLPFGLLVGPSSVHASTKHSDKVIQTKLETSPVEPKGQNDWYTSVTLVELNSIANGTTYFQWNSTSSEWSKYKEPIRAWRGENTLYYYSVSRGGVKEAIQTKVIKVDYLKPVIKSIKPDSVNADATLTINSDEEMDHYIIYKRFDSQYRIIDTVLTNAYTDKDVKIGRTYVYGVVAVDQAGLKSKMAQGVVKVVTPVIVPSITVIPVAQAVIQTKIKPQIAQGVSIYSADGKGSSETLNTDTKPLIVDNQQPSTENGSKEPAGNWNRLLVAISILIIAAGAAIGGYYGYEWWVKGKEVAEKPKEKKTNSRW